MGRNFSFFIDGESSELVERYEKHLSGKAPGYFDVDEMERIVDYYLSYGRTKDSMRAVELGKKLHPASSTLDMKRAKVYLAIGDVKKALRILSNLVENSDPEITFLKIEALAKLARNQEAFELAVEVIKKEEVDDGLDLLCVDLAMIFIGEAEFEFALELLKTGNKHNPENIDLLFDMALCQEQLMKPADAVQTYKQIIDIDPYSGEAWFNLGQVHFFSNQYENALEAYEYALVIDENDNLALLQKGHSLFQLGRWQPAAEAYLEYADFTSDKWQVWLFTAECYEKMENFAKALHYYKLSHQEMKDNFDALAGISICLLEMEQFQESISYINKALEIDSEQAEAWLYLAEAKVGLEEYKEALEAYHQAVSIDPNQPDALLAMGNIYMDYADFKMALKYYELAYSFDPTLEFIELFIAVASYYANDYDKVSEFLKRAVHRNLDAKKFFFELCPDADEGFLNQL